MAIVNSVCGADSAAFVTELVECVELGDGGGRGRVGALYGWAGVEGCGDVG